MKTTKKDFEVFKTTFIHWQNLLGLKDWQCFFEHVPLDDCFGNITTDSEGRVGTVRFSSRLPSHVHSFDSRRTARHEALELLLDDLGTLAQYRYVRYDEIKTARHAVIRRLENLLDHIEKAGGGGKA